MTALFHFEEKIHHRNLSRVETIPLMFLRLLCQVSKHLGFPVEPQLERRRVYTVVFTVEKWQFVPGAPPIPLRDPAEDQPPPTVPVEEPHIPASIAPSATDPLPASSAPSVPSVLADLAGPSTSASPMETIPISPRDFLAIMTIVRSFTAKVKNIGFDGYIGT